MRLPISVTVTVPYLLPFSRYWRLSFEYSLFSSSYPLAEKRHAIQFRCWQYGSIFIRLALVGSQICEIPRKSEKIRTYSSSRSYKVVDLGVNRKRIYDFLLIIYSHYMTYLLYLLPFLRYWHLKLENGVFSQPLPYLTLPLGEPVRISGWNWPAHTRGMGLPYSGNNPTVFDWSTRVTDRRTGDSIWRTKHVCYTVGR